MADKKPNSVEIESLIPALRDQDGMVRQHARERLVLLGSPATPFLVPLLSEDKDQTRWEAAKALSEIADPAGVPALLNALEDEDSDVRWLAAVGLIAIGPTTAAPLLRHLIERIDSAWIRQGAHHVLAELRRTEIGDTIADVYTALGGLHSEVEIIAAADQALRKMKPVD